MYKNDNRSIIRPFIGVTYHKIIYENFNVFPKIAHNILIFNSLSVLIKFTFKRLTSTSKGDILIIIPIQRFIKMIGLKIRPIVIQHIEIRINTLHRKEAT